MQGVARSGSSLPGSRAAKSSSSWGPAPPSHLDHYRCVAVHRRRVAVVVVAPVVAVFIVALSRWLPLCHRRRRHLRFVVVMGTQGSHWPRRWRVAEVSMWGGGLGCGKATVGVAPGQQCEPAINVSTMWA